MDRKITSYIASLQKTPKTWGSITGNIVLKKRTTSGPYTTTPDKY